MGLINTGRFLFPSVMSLQARAVDDLHVDAELAAAVVEDEHADAATARVEGGLETLPEVGLVHDGEVLLDVTGLGHGDDYDVVSTLQSYPTHHWTSGTGAGGRMRTYPGPAACRGRGTA